MKNILRLTYFRVFSAILIVTQPGFTKSAISKEDYIRKNAIKLDLNDLNNLYSKISAYRVISLGEMHGTNEIPNFTSKLFNMLYKKNKSIALALEIPSEEQESINNFVKSKDLSVLKKSIFFTDDYQDGRRSQAMIQLLREIPADAVVICYDTTDYTNAQNRDFKMAENLLNFLSKNKKSKLLILSGNIHAGIDVGTPFDKSFKPMGYFLHSIEKSSLKKKDILAMNVEYEDGTAWICTTNKPDDCKARSIKPPISVYTLAVNYEIYFVRENLDNGYNAKLYFRKLSYSPPALK